MEGANLIDARMQGAELIEAAMEGALLVGAHMEGAELSFALLDGANLSSADLKGAIFDDARMQGVTLDKVTMDARTKFQGANLSQSYIRNCDLSFVQMTRHQRKSMFADTSVTLPNGITPGHVDWPTKWPCFNLGRAFLAQYRAWLANPAAYTPPLPPSPQPNPNP
jgi:hypothetical protein